MKWMCVSIPPAVTMHPSPAMTSVPAPMTHARRDALLDAWIPRVPDPHDAPAFHADVRLHHTLHGVEDERVRDDKIERLRIARRGRLPHPVADDFAAAKFHLIAIRARLGDVVALDLDEELRIGQPHLIADSRPKHLGVLPAGEVERHIRKSSAGVSARTVPSPAPSADAGRWRLHGHRLRRASRCKSRASCAGRAAGCRLRSRPRRR